MAECDAIAICVPTPLSKSKDHDLSYVVAAADAVLAGESATGQVTFLLVETDI